ncbi:MAG: hypothetical protein M3R14_11890 [Acidobacteriota bacterium]|nr:hypothetical protein [Acidobacteriota bacterium]
MITIRKYTEADKERIWEIIKFVISTGDTFNSSPDSTPDEMLGDWCSAEKLMFVAVSENKVVAPTVKFSAILESNLRSIYETFYFFCNFAYRFRLGDISNHRAKQSTE